LAIQSWSVVPRCYDFAVGVASTLGSNAAGRLGGEHRRVIFASSLGTMFEWYDFFMYGSLSAILAKQFFSGVDEVTGFILALAAFGAGAIVRPLGAVVFGRLGDLFGRKRTFLVTIVVMGSATALVGMLPTYASIGVAAPILLVALRMLQGLALGGEYGGAAVYVAEHATEDRRGYYTGWIQTAGPVGLSLSLAVVFACRHAFGPDFDRWGWRVPFLLSVVLLAISVYIRLKLEESPVFLRMRAEGTLSRAPVREAFGEAGNLRLVLLVLFGAVAGQAVVGYATHLSVVFFLDRILRVDPAVATLMIAAALLATTPLFVWFGSLADRIGCKRIVLGGCLLGVLTLFPAYKALTHFANPALSRAAEVQPVTVVADLKSCELQWDPLGGRTFESGCDIARSVLARAGVPYSTGDAPHASGAFVGIGSGSSALRAAVVVGRGLGRDEFKAASSAFENQLLEELHRAGYPVRADPATFNAVIVLAICLYLSVVNAMTYGPLAAWLVELFPARIRYSAISVPYHIGNGWFGGFMPFTSFAIVAATGDIYAGLWYPVLIAAATVVIGGLFLPDTPHHGKRRT